VAQRTASLPVPGPFRRAWGAVTARRGFRALAMVNAVLLWLIIPSGGIVRLTDSGLGCTDWPLCDNGALVPAATHHAWIEYTNRMLSAVIMGVAVLTWLVARRVDGRPRAARRAALVAAVATVGQVPLGAVTVVFDLHPLLVGSHFLLSIVALSAAVVCVTAADDHLRRARRAWRRIQSPLAVGSAVALLGVIVTGVLVTAAGPHSGDPDVLDRFGNLDQAAYIHVRVVVGFLALGAALAVWVWRRGTADRTARILALCFLPALIAQIVIGEVQWRTELPWEVVVFHVSIAGLVWGIGAALALRLARPVVTGDPPAPTGETAGAGGPARA
jgi:cytochrome c oxidase assembly protein subunit 15